MVGLMLALLALLAAVPAAAGEKEGGPPLVVRLSVDLVQVDAVVTDGKGRPVTDLHAADFEIIQDGRAQAVTQAVYMGGTAPSSRAGASVATVSGGAEGEIAEQPDEALVFVVDDRALSVGSVDATRRALLRFADAMASEGAVFLLRTSGRAVDLQPVGGPAELRAAVRALRPRLDRSELHEDRSFRGTPFEDQARATGAYLNRLLAERSLLSLQDITDALRSWRGRKTLILFSEGFPIRNPGERVDSPLDQVYRRGEDVLDAVERLTDLANRASVVIHTLDPRGLLPAGISASDSVPMELVPTAYSALLQDRHAALHTSQASLAYIAEQTGGLAIANSNDLGAGVASILSGSRGYYLVGYEPGRATFAGGRPRFHQLQVRVKRRGLKVRSRKGFFGVSDEALPSAPFSTSPPESSPDGPPRRQLREVLAR
jgi:VWFA-related protein